jgi:hypothetical protein
MKKMKFDGKDIFEIILAALIVNDAPALIGGVTGKNFSGIVEDVIGGGLGVIVGHIAKKPLMVNASIALAVFNIVNGFLVPQVQQLLPVKSQAPGLPTGAALKPAVMPTKGAAVADYGYLPKLSAYMGGFDAGVISSYQNYRNAYMHE